MEKPPFLRVMTITMVILLAILVALSLWMFRTDSSGYAIFYVVPIALYHFFFCLMLNLLGYNIYKKNQTGIIICSIVTFPFLFPYFDTSSFLRFWFGIFGMLGRISEISMLFLGIYVFIYPKLWKILAAFGVILIVCILLFHYSPLLFALYSISIFYLA
ncbi:hypothetical protein [Capnocytophaga granulosa]|uniref:hypothetical protein n=1 Tax=Capnocytophaga granulosa TaxID=45242 RepID=UPI0028E3D0F9|nr:hypothetical protein [Capnocytophaga granulosa]